jgi:lysophospholipase L1-like esterase
VSTDGLARLPAALAEHGPELLILCHGGNDLLRRKGARQLEANLRAMIDLARGQGVDVVLIGVPEPGLFLSAADLYERIADDYRIPYDGDTLPQVLGDRDLKSDAIHPNDDGYGRLAESLAALLRKSGAVPR